MINIINMCLRIERDCSYIYYCYFDLHYHKKPTTKLFCCLFLTNASKNIYSSIKIFVIIIKHEVIKMAFTITIDQFEGPLDLMLHLVKDNKLDLFDLDMNVLTEQYLQYINTMDSLHLEVASEFLSELAGLIEYKSKKLLPREEVLIEEDFEEDQRERLVKRLLEYQRFKEVSGEFEKNYEHRQRLLEKPMSDITQTWMNVTMESDLSGNPYDLIKAMNKVLRRIALQHPYETKMTIKELSLDERVVQIKQQLKDWVGKMSFEQLCHDCVDLHMVIVTFLSLLDLIKHKEITFHLDDNETIWIVKGEVVYG